MAAPVDPDTTGQDDIVYRTRFEPNESRSLSIAVIEAVATLEEIEPDKIHLQLYDWIESEALVALFRHAREHTRAAWNIEFAVDEYQVVVRSTGEISIKQT